MTIFISHYIIRCIREIFVVITQEDILTTNILIIHEMYFSLYETMIREIFVVIIQDDV